MNEAFIRRESDAGKDLGVNVVHIDDGWEIGKTIAHKGASRVWEWYRAHQADFWQFAPEKLPHGFLPLAEYVQTRGMELGVWFGPNSANDLRDWKQDAD